MENMADDSINREVEWRAPGWAIERWMDLMEDLLDLDMDSSEAMDLKDQIRCLPNFPPDTDEYTLITVVNTTVH